MKYNANQRKQAVLARLSKIATGPKPDYNAPRKTSYLSVKINGIKTVVVLEPYERNVTQWVVTINGKLFSEHCGMNKVYLELARLNPPARNFD